MLSALESATSDPNDPATAACAPNGNYGRFLQAGALKGARVGIPRRYFYEATAIGGAVRGGLTDAQQSVMTEAIAALKGAGATVVDPVDIPSISASTDNLVAWPACSGPEGAKGRDAQCSTVFKYGMKRDFNRWLASLGTSAPVRTLTELRQWNSAHAAAGTLKYGQVQLDISDEMDLERDRERYLADRAKDLRLSRVEGIDAALRAANLDALIFPAATGASLPAKAGYPSVTVPFGRVAPASAAPEEFRSKPVPFGVTFTGTACSEGRLIQLAFAFEQATKRRVPPAL
jgi:amidase